LAKGEDDRASVFSAGISLRIFLADKPIFDRLFDAAVFSKAEEDASTRALNEIVANSAVDVYFAEIERVQHLVSAGSSQHSTADYLKES
jgi:hypothetical protein